MKSIITGVVSFVVGIWCGAILYFLYIDRINQAYEKNITEMRIQADLGKFWALKYNKIDDVKKEVAESIRMNQKKMKEDFKKEIQIPAYIDSSIEAALLFNDTGVKYTTYPYEGYKKQMEKQPLIPASN